MAAPCFWVPHTQFMFVLITKTSSTSVIPERSPAARLDGLSSYRTLTTLWNTFLDQQTPWLICCYEGRTLTRGWIPINLVSYSLITSLLQQILLRYTKFSLTMTLTCATTSYRPFMTPQLLDIWAFQTLGNLFASNTKALDSENLWNNT